MMIQRETLYLNTIFINIFSSYNLLDIDDTEISDTIKSIQFGLENFLL